MGIYRHLHAATIFLALLMSTGASAQGVCPGLQNSLSAIDREIAARSSAGQGSSRAAYQALYDQAASLGCFDRRIFQSRQCRGLTDQIERLQNSLSVVGSTDQLQAQRSLIRQQMATNGCAEAATMASGGGTRVRTLCVRVCDGYYFPISNAATRDQLPTDALVCQARCPGQEVSLYTIRPDEDDVAGARSASGGGTYSELSNAFNYRTDYQPECGCGPVAEDAESILIAALGPDRAARLAASIGLSQPDGPYSPASTESLAALTPPPAVDLPPLPLPRPVTSEDPETLANRAGGFSPDSYLRAAPALVASDSDVVNGIRLIGPAYLYYSPVRLPANSTAATPTIPPVSPALPQPQVQPAALVAATPPEVTAALQ